jgi:hypothetical protein
MEPVHRFDSIEQARNAAIRWLELHGVVIGPYRKIEIGRLGVLAGYEVGVSATAKPFWRLRLDYDPVKGPHYNAEYRVGGSRLKAAFAFPGTVEWMRRLAHRLRRR